MKQEKEMPFNGDFEDSEADEDEVSQESESEEEQIQVKKKKKKVVNSSKKLIMNVSDTQYPVVKFVGKMIYKFKLSYVPYLENNNWDFCWTDNAVLPETLSKMQPHQRINHFPGMYSLARKNHLGRNLNKMQKQYPEEYDFYPRTWMLPSEYGDFKAQFQKGKAKTFIVKPEASCQGKGIFLTRSIDSINPQEHYVAQRYIHKPLLIDGLKFDLRMYVMICGCDPLRIYLYKEGLARFATQLYSSPHSTNLDDVCMHLTNYAINKDNPNFIFNEDDKKMDIGHKRSMTSVFEFLRLQKQNVDLLLSDIKDLIIKTFCAVQPILQQNYTQIENYANNMCFEILGFDILIDSSLKPYLLEVNHTPSFTTDTPLDSYIKKNLIRDAITLMNINVKTKNDIISQKKDQMQKRVLTGKKTKLSYEEKKVLKMQAQKERDEYEFKNKGDFELIYPCDKSYDEYLLHAQKLYEDWTGANIRRNLKRDTISEQPKPQSCSQKPINNQKNQLYKHVQSKVNTNLYPIKTTKADQEITQEEPEQNIQQVPEPIQSQPQLEPDNFVTYEDYQQSDSLKDLYNFAEKRIPEIQLIDLIQFRRAESKQDNSSFQIIQMSQQNSLSNLSPLMQIKSIQDQKNEKKFSIRKKNKQPKQIDQEQLYFQPQSHYQPSIQQHSISYQQQVQMQNGSFVKPKVFSLKLQHPPKGYKLQSLPILMQQNYTKQRYEQGV
ncbi:unnamed protein product [Paramecium sonneborni]|uniref:Tubulin-tyrosine ligase family protein n=1 Tax=Paramecium sonneborni TaxID=65129 RepID=A0A8S1NSY5_9CILI|nr:unnamed protein product [Paramecium sonneborni]